MTAILYIFLSLLLHHLWGYVVFSDTLNAHCYLCLNDNEMHVVYSIGLFSTIQICNGTSVVLLNESTTHNMPIP